MKIDHIVRAWKDQSYRQKLSAAEQAELPAHPSGMIELTDADLGRVSGGAHTLPCPTHPCPTHVGAGCVTHNGFCTTTCD